MGKWSVHVGGTISGSGETPGGRRAEPWIQALKVYQEQREARQASGWKGAGEGSRDGSRPGTGAHHGQASRGCSTGSKHLPSLAPPAAVTGDPQPLPTPLTGTGATTMPHVSSTCCSDPAVSGHRPSRSWEGRGGQGFLHRPWSSAHPAAVSLGTSSNRWLQNPHDLTWGRVWPPPTQQQGWTDKHSLTHVPLP